MYPITIDIYKTEHIQCADKKEEVMEMSELQFCDFMLSVEFKD